jgi:hypothetical protein
MQYDVVIKNNYFLLVERTGENHQYEGLLGTGANCVFVRSESSTSDTFYFSGLNGFPTSQGVDVSDLFLDDEAFTRSEWVDFYTSSTGKSSAGDSATIHVQNGENTTFTGDGTEGNPLKVDATGGGGAVKKEFVMYIGGQDATGFLNTDVKADTCDTTFTFTRIGAGLFECTQFDPTKHIMIPNASYSGAVFFDREEFVLYGNKYITTLDDDAFERGGFIKIEEY